jgi:hypothetical protein
MSSTSFEGPLRVGGSPTGVSSTDKRGFVPAVKQIDLTQGAARQIVTLPPKSTLLRVGAVRTSALTGGTDFLDARVNFGTSADADQYGIVPIANTMPNELVKKIKQCSLGVSANLTVPGGSTITALGAILTSAIPGDASSARVSFGDGADVNQYAIVGVSGADRLQWVNEVSGAVIDSDATIVVALSAVSTTTITGGGGRAFVEYLTNDRAGTAVFQPVTSGAAEFDDEATVVVTLSAIATTSFTGGGARAFIEYITVE